MSIKETISRFIEDTEVGRTIESHLPLLKKAGIAAAVVAVLSFGLISHSDTGKEVEVIEEPVVAEETVPDRIFVDIGGEVNHPMLAELDDGCRVEDAIEAAGGLTADADLSSINRAAFVNDGDKIYIPSVDETDFAGGTQSQPSLSPGSGTGKVNINTADAQELQTLTGIGPVTADKIVSYRESNGRFANIEDIKKVSGIGEKTFEKFKDSITT